MILPLGGRGPGFDSRFWPLFFAAVSLSARALLGSGRFLFVSPRRFPVLAFAFCRALALCWGASRFWPLSFCFAGAVPGSGRFLFASPGRFLVLAFAFCRALALCRGPVLAAFFCFAGALPWVARAGVSVRARVGAVAPSLLRCVCLCLCLSTCVAVWLCGCLSCWVARWLAGWWSWSFGALVGVGWCFVGGGACLRFRVGFLVLPLGLLSLRVCPVCFLLGCSRCLSMCVRVFGWPCFPSGCSRCLSLSVSGPVCFLLAWRCVSFVVALRASARAARAVSLCVWLAVLPLGLLWPCGWLAVLPLAWLCCVCLSLSLCGWLCFLLGFSRSVSLPVSCQLCRAIASACCCRAATRGGRRAGAQPHRGRGR